MATEGSGLKGLSWSKKTVGYYNPCLPSTGSNLEGAEQQKQG